MENLTWWVEISGKFQGNACGASTPSVGVGVIKYPEQVDGIKNRVFICLVVFLSELSSSNVKVESQVKSHQVRSLASWEYAK